MALDPEIDRVTLLFLKFDMAKLTLRTATWARKIERHGTWLLLKFDEAQGEFYATKNATFQFLKIDTRHQDPTLRDPYLLPVRPARGGGGASHHVHDDVYQRASGIKHWAL